MEVGLSGSMDPDNIVILPLSESALKDVHNGTKLSPVCTYYPSENRENAGEKVNLKYAL